MQIDELRGELTMLADEMDAFEGDVVSLHRRQRRRRIVVSSLIAVIVGVVGVSTVALVRQDDAHHVQVTGAGPKEVAPAKLSHIDVIVVPADPDVQGALDTSPLVANYARVPRAYRGGEQSFVSIPRDARCALETHAGFAVRASVPGPNFADLVRRSLGTSANVFDVSTTLGTDVRLFMKVGASRDAATAIETRLTRDASVESFHYVDTTEAYDSFKRQFADQPALVESTKPSDLPTSFQIRLMSGASAPAAAGRYEHLAGVDMVIAPVNPRMSLLFRRDLYPRRGTSACVKP
jgi:hypothetical protein